MMLNPFKPDGRHVVFSKGVSSPWEDSEFIISPRTPSEMEKSVFVSSFTGSFCLQGDV